MSTNCITKKTTSAPHYQVEDVHGNYVVASRGDTTVKLWGTALTLGVSSCLPISTARALATAILEMTGGEPEAVEVEVRRPVSNEDIDVLQNRLKVQEENIAALDEAGIELESRLDSAVIALEGLALMVSTLTRRLNSAAIELKG